MDIEFDRDIRFDVGRLFELAFGINPPVMFPYPLQVHRPDMPHFNVGGEKEHGLVKFYGIKENPQITPSSRKGHFGKNILFPIKFESGTYKVFDERGVLTTKNMPDFDLPATTMVDFSRSKNIVLTPQNTIEPIAEMYGWENWKIKIRGLCLYDQAHPTHKTAQEQKEALLQWENITDGISVIGSIFSEKHIFYMAIENINITQVEGRPNVVPFEMNCISLTHPYYQTL